MALIVAETGHVACNEEAVPMGDDSFRASAIRRPFWRGALPVWADSETMRLLALLTIIAIVGAILRPAYAFSIDDMIYAEMARAFWENQSLAIGDTGGVDGAPELTWMLTHAIDGQVVPQYPALYGIIAAPFFGLGGMIGLAVMNGLAFPACLLLSARIARHLFGTRIDPRVLIALLSVATFLPVYAIGVWPHLLAMAFVLAGIERAVCHMDTRADVRAHNLLLAGMWLSLAIAIRVDALMPAIAVIAWMAVLGAPGKKLAPVLLIGGMVPFLLLASALNQAKFGTFIPISYGPKNGADGVANYTVMLAAMAGVLAGLCIVNPQRGWAGRIVALAVKPRNLAVISGAAMVMIAAVSPLRNLVWNAWVLVVDLQAMDARQVSGATMMGADGFIHIIGIHKKSLIQSTPAFAVTIAGVIGFLRGERTAARGLCLLVVCATFGFYALSQWHGGYSFNMRYFMIALPFLAMLGLDATGPWLDADGQGRLRRDLAMGGGAGVLVAGAIYLIAASSAVMTLTLPLIVAGLLCAATVWLVFAAGSPRSRMVWRALCGAALALSVIATAGDLYGQNQRLQKYAPIIDATASAFPEGALVATHIEEHFLHTPASGAHVISVRRYTGMPAKAAIAAFIAADRCVFVHTQRTLAGMDLPGEWRAQSLPGLMGAGVVFMQPTQQSAQCQLSAR